MKAVYNGCARVICDALEKSGYVIFDEIDDRLDSEEFLSVKLQEATEFTFKLSNHE